MTMVNSGLKGLGDYKSNYFQVKLHIFGRLAYTFEKKASPESYWINTMPLSDVPVFFKNLHALI